MRTRILRVLEDVHRTRRARCRAGRRRAGLERDFGGTDGHAEGARHLHRIVRRGDSSVRENRVRAKLNRLRRMRGQPDAGVDDDRDMALLDDGTTC